MILKLYKLSMCGLYFYSLTEPYKGHLLCPLYMSFIIFLKYLSIKAYIKDRKIQLA